MNNPATLEDWQNGNAIRVDAYVPDSRTPPITSFCFTEMEAIVNVLYLYFLNTHTTIRAVSPNGVEIIRMRGMSLSE